MAYKKTLLYAVYSFMVQLRISGESKLNRCIDYTGSDFIF